MGSRGRCSIVGACFSQAHRPSLQIKQGLVLGVGGRVVVGESMVCDLIPVATIEPRAAAWAVLEVIFLVVRVWSIDRSSADGCVSVHVQNINWPALAKVRPFQGETLR